MRNNPLNIVNNNVEAGPQVHVRFEGRSYTFEANFMDVGSASTDDQIKAAVANQLDVPAARLSDMMIEREDNGNFTVRPEAVFG